MSLIDDLRAPRLDTAALRATIEAAAETVPHAEWLAILRDRDVPAVARRFVIRRLLGAAARPGETLGELGARSGAETWLAPGHVRHVSMIAGKIPVAWTAEDRVIYIDVCPATPGDGDGHRLLVYLRIAGEPAVDELVAGLRGAGGAAGAHVVRELGYFESDAPVAALPVLAGVVLCRRALRDADSGLHTLVDVLLDVPVERVPGTATFDVYLQLARLTGAATLVLEVSEAGGAVLSSGTLALGAGPGAAAAPPPVLGIAIPNVMVSFARAGEHRLRVRSGGELLGEYRFSVVVGGGA